MKNRITKRGVTSLLILFAMLVALVAAFLPAVVSADPAPAAEDGEIEDFCYQTLIGADVKDSASTDLRFLFSVGSLAYDAVGFVFSTSNDPVKVDEPKKNYTTSATVYGTVTANDEPIDAPAGRHWAAIKLSDIPHASFATYVYVRPFVEDGEGTRYGETQRINVCEALGHAHEIKYPYGTATLLTPGTRCGDCEACGLYGIVEEDVCAAVADVTTENRYQVGNYTASTVDEYVFINAALGQGETYYPDAENNLEGRDFYYEIDVLWNETMANCANDNLGLSLYLYNKGERKGYYCYLFRLALRNDSGLRSKYAGGFDYYSATAIAEGPAGADGEQFGQFPNLNDSPSENDWGWHRIGVRIHEQAETDGATVTYTGYAYLYIDGEERWKTELDMNALAAYPHLLYTMDVSGNYTANSSDRFSFSLWSDTIKNSALACYVITANKTARAVIPSEFSTGVVPVENPVDSKYVWKWDADAAVFPAKVFFKAEN